MPYTFPEDSETAIEKKVYRVKRFNPEEYTPEVAKCFATHHNHNVPKDGFYLGGCRRSWRTRKEVHQGDYLVESPLRAILVYSPAWFKRLFKSVR